MSSTNVKVSLRLVGDELDPTAVTEVVGCEPTESHIKGELLESAHSTRRAPIGVWLLTSTCKDNLEQAIADLLDKVNSDESTWAKLSDHFEAEFYIGVFSDEGQTGLSLSAALLKRISALGISLAFDIYAL